MHFFEHVEKKFGKDRSEILKALLIYGFGAMLAVGGVFYLLGFS